MANRLRLAPGPSGNLEGTEMLLYPIFFFLFGCHVKLDRVQSNDFKDRSAIGALDDIPLVSIIIHLDL